MVTLRITMFWFVLIETLPGSKILVRGELILKVEFTKKYRSYKALNEIIKIAADCIYASRGKTIFVYKCKFLFNFQKKSLLAR